MSFRAILRVQELDPEKVYDLLRTGPSPVVLFSVEVDGSPKVGFGR